MFFLGLHYHYLKKNKNHLKKDINLILNKAKLCPS